MKDEMRNMYSEYIVILFIYSDDTDPDALWNPEPEMSEEIRLAFADFVKANRR